MPLFRFALFALVCATACRSTTLADSAPVVRGATYDPLGTAPATETWL